MIARAAALLESDCAMALCFLFVLSLMLFAIEVHA